MSKETSKANHIDVKARVFELAQDLLEEGVNPGEISYWLAAISADLGFQLAPSPEKAFAVIFEAMREVSETHAGKDGVVIEPENELDPKGAPSDAVIH